MPLDNEFQSESFQFLKTGRADGIYISETGKPHNFLASPAQAETLMWAKPCDYAKGFHLFGSYNEPISITEYYSLADFNPKWTGIPGRDGNSN